MKFENRSLQQKEAQKNGNRMRVNFCSLKYNLTLAIRETRLNRLIFMENNQIKGDIGVILNNYFGLNQKK